MKSLYREMRFIEVGSDASLLSKVIIERLPDQSVSLVLAIGRESDVGEDFVDDAMRLHRLLNLLRARVVPRLASLEVVVERFELLDLLLAEPDRRDSGSVGHASRLAGSRIKREVTT